MPTSPFGNEKIAVTLGDAAGVGPEVTVKAILSLPPAARAGLVVLGPASFFNDIARRLSLTPVFGRSVACYFPARFPSKVIRGRSNRVLSRLAVRSIRWAVAFALRGAVDAIVTAPVNKAALQEAGFRIPGHTEYLAKLSKAKRFEMMLVGGGLRVTLVTRHLAMKSVARTLTRSRIAEAIRLTDFELRRSFGLRRPRIAVCALNPHAGEKGNFGREEIEIITPAVKAARKTVKAEIRGPLPADVLFHEAYRGRYDAEICMYHDQGLIPLKMISRGSGVNVTLGLPFVRTSPDHGTGYDIAPSFKADAGSMKEALLLAAQLSKNRKKHGRNPHHTR